MKKWVNRKSHVSFLYFKFPFSHLLFPQVLEGDTQIGDETGLSPAELAKAYMGGQTPSSSSKVFAARNEKDSFDGGLFGAKSFVASPSTKPSACWPGIKLSEQSGFETPQNQRGSYGLQNFPRTPYSRSILSNSKSKVCGAFLKYLFAQNIFGIFELFLVFFLQLMQLQDNSSKRLNTLQSPSQSVQTRYGQVNTQ